MFASLENRHAYEYLQLEQAWLSCVESPDLPSLDRLSQRLGAATLAFGRCELHHRAAGRSEQTGQTDFAAAHLARAKAFQDEGFEQLKLAAGFAADVKVQYDQVPAPEPADAKRVATAFSDEFMALIADTDLKPSDVEKIDTVMKAALKTVLSGKNPGEAIEARINELEAERRRDDRGVRDNIPMWKLVLIAAKLLIAVVYVVRCLLQDRCTPAEKAAFYLAALIFGISIKFC